jgi:2,4-dienoyl-CoA reductase-like NADH-dependent reductase (Old Yellow Enzyme family)
MKGVDVTPAAMTEDEILETIQNFVETSKRVVAAGADGVEIHSAHVISSTSSSRPVSTSVLISGVGPSETDPD